MYKRQLRDTFSQLEIKVIAFGSQPIVTETLLPLFSHCITVVNHNDFATRMSYSAMVALKHDIHRVTNDEIEDTVVPQVSLAHVDVASWQSILDAQAHRYLNIQTDLQVQVTQAQGTYDDAGSRLP